MQLPPPLDQLDRLRNAAFLASPFPPLPAAVAVETGVGTVGLEGIRLPAFVADEDDSGLEVLLVHEAIIGADLVEGGEGVGVGVVDGDAMLLWGAVAREEIIQVNKIVGEVELAIDDQRLLRLLTLEYERPRLNLRSDHYFQH